MKKLLITIDGPAGAGKTSVSKILARRLGYRRVDTGALYRGMAYEALRKGISEDDDENLKRMCSDIDLEFVNIDRGQRLLSRGEDITGLIRTPEISMLASILSAKAHVREALLELQRRLGRGKDAVFEGRDMGTVVFPDADVKFFLEASADVRARRRYLELPEGSSETLESVGEDMAERDARDASRAVAPLKPAGDAIIVDSSFMGMDEVLDFMLARVRKAGALE